MNGPGSVIARRKVHGSTLDGGGVNGLLNRRQGVVSFVPRRAEVLDVVDDLSVGDRRCCAGQQTAASGKKPTSAGLLLLRISLGQIELLKISSLSSELAQRALERWQPPPFAHSTEIITCIAINKMWQRRLPSLLPHLTSSPY